MMLTGEVRYGGESGGESTDCILFNKLTEQGEGSYNKRI